MNLNARTSLTALCRYQLYELTGISPDRQKITVGAKQITDTTDLASMGLKEKQVVATLPTYNPFASRRNMIASIHLLLAFVN